MSPASAMTPHPSKELRDEPLLLLLQEAAELRSVAASLAERSDFESGPAAEDAAKLAASAERFESRLESWFSDDAAAQTPDPEFHRRQARHEARNGLNHLFGRAQLLEMLPLGTESRDVLGTFLATLERCLAIVSEARFLAGQERQAEGLDHKEGKGAETGGGSTDPPGQAPLPLLRGSERTSRQRDGRLLVADDDPENRELLARLLVPCGFDVDFAENGRVALARLAEGLYDAVLLDIEMPVMDGFAVLATMRESGELRHTPVIVVTGLQAEADAVRCIEIGAEDFLSRPIRPALLMARLDASLEKKRLREKVFEQHFTPELARELARNPDPMKMQARQAEVSVLFCDIRGFSAISERLGPSQTIGWLGAVMGEFSSLVIERGGVLVDYTGDELMAMWGAPNEQPDHAALACAAARDILASLDRLNETWRPLVGAETEVGIGVNTGEALVGNVGSHRKFKYGPLGTTVNLASRVQGATKYLRSSLLITENTAAQLPEGFHTRRLCQVRVRNIQKPIRLFELEPPHGGASWSALKQRYESALDEYEGGNFHRASAVLGDVLLTSPEDGPSLQLMARVVEAMLEEEGGEFSPIWSLPGK